MLLQVLVATSFLIAGYLDVKRRRVPDLVWVPAIVGLVLVFYNASAPANAFLIVRIVAVGSIPLSSRGVGSSAKRTG